MFAVSWCFLFLIFVLKATIFNFNVHLFVVFMSQDSVVSIVVTGLQAGRSGVRIPAGPRDFIFTKCPDWLLGPPSLLFGGYRGLFPGGKVDGPWGWPLSSSAQVKNYWSHTSVKPFFQKEKINVGSCTVLTLRFDPLWLFHVLEIKNLHEGVWYWVSFEDVLSNVMKVQRRTSENDFQPRQKRWNLCIRRRII
jgi:hypothetical protein